MHPKPRAKKRGRRAMPDALRRLLSQTIIENYSAGGVSWQGYTYEECLAVYGCDAAMPSFLRRHFEEKAEKTKRG